MLATLGMGMSLRDSSLVILFFSLLTCIPPAFMGIGGMETGLRQLVQARYSFGCVRTQWTIPLVLADRVSPGSISSRCRFSSTPPL